MQSQVVRRPTREHLRLDTSDDELISESEQPEIIITPQIIQKERLGVYFLIDQLLENLTSSELDTTMKKIRIDKWHVMITYGLDQDIAHKVFKFKNKDEERLARNRRINNFNHGSSFNPDHRELK